MAKKATSEDQVSKFEDIPNIGPSIASDLRSIGITNPKQLLKLDPYKLYLKLCNETNQYHDPCVLDVFLSAKHFMSGNKSLAWWTFTEERKANFSIIRNSLEKKFKS